MIGRTTRTDRLNFNEDILQLRICFLSVSIFLWANKNAVTTGLRGPQR